MTYNIFILIYNTFFVKRYAMTLHDIGMNYRHEPDFYIDRPNGSGDNLMLIFKTPAKIKLGEKEIAAPAGTAIVYKKGTAQSYGADNSEYINHWLHFDADESDIFHLTSGMRFDTPILLKNCNICEKIMNEINLERLSGNPTAGICIDILLRLLLVRIGENFPTDGKNEISCENPHSRALRELRAEIYENTSSTITINSLAAKLGLSPSYFQSLYKAQFGVSCYEDAITARIRAAKYYLRTTRLSVKEISALCGCDNPEHFMRQFRARTGLTPTEYRTNA